MNSSFSLHVPSTSAKKLRRWIGSSFGSLWRQRKRLAGTKSSSSCPLTDHTGKKIKTGNISSSTNSSLSSKKLQISHQFFRKFGPTLRNRATSTYAGLRRPSLCLGSALNHLFINIKANNVTRGCFNFIHKLFINKYLVINNLEKRSEKFICRKQVLFRIFKKFSHRNKLVFKRWESLKQEEQWKDDCKYVD